MSTLVQPAYLPADRSEVTETWLADTLASHPTFTADPLHSVELEHLGDGMGQLSTLIIAHLRCASGAAHQLVVKLHANVPDMHDIGLRYNHYESEINFYNHLADDVPMRTPEMYVAHMDRASERVLLIMESFAGWHSPDQIEGATLEEVTIAAEHLAGLTASFWNAPAQQRYPWLRNLQSDAYRSLSDDYAEGIDEMVERLHESLPASANGAARTIAPKFRALMDDLCGGNQALSHWDYRVENLFFGQDGEFAVIDWQLMMMTNPATDLAYLLSSNIDAGLRRKAEGDLMDGFLEGLARHGVSSYTREELEHDYRKALMGVSCIAVIGGSGFDVENERSHALFSAAASRMFQAIEDWDALDLLP